MVAIDTFPYFIFGERTNWKVLDLFCAGYLGQNTTAHLLPSSSKYIGVDIDDAKLETMLERYPDAKFHHCNIYKLLEYDKYQPVEIVVSDQPTAHNARVYEQLGAVLRMATRWAVIGTNIGDMHLLPLDHSGFFLQGFWRRSDHMGGTYWAIYKKQ